MLVRVNTTKGIKFIKACDTASAMMEFTDLNKEGALAISARPATKEEIESKDTVITIFSEGSHD